MDVNKDGVVTLEEFLDCCNNDEDISRSMTVFDSSFWRSPVGVRPLPPWSWGMIAPADKEPASTSHVHSNTEILIWDRCDSVIQAGIHTQRKMKKKEKKN